MYKRQQRICADVISRFEGHIAQYLGDGLLVYFGYPVAHEDDAARAVRAGLDIVEVLQRLPHVGYEVPSPLVGREHEVGLLGERWERAKQAEGQVVLLGGEPGIGKSRLVQVVRERVGKDDALQLEFRCSPYHQNSAFYPVIDFLQGRLQFSREDVPEEKLRKLVAGIHVPFQADAIPLFASLLSLPHPEGYPPLNLSPQRQKQKTQEALVAWLVAEAERTPVYCPWEDVQWADPSTLEVLTLLIDQVPTARLYLLLTFRSEFTPPWGTRSHVSHLVLNRLGRTQITQMIEKVAGGTLLPPEVAQQIVAKTDGVPLFVEELTKMVVESVGATDRSSFSSLAIPTTLHDALMARLDRLNTAKEIAQVGATLGREFGYALLHAVSPLDEATLRKGLTQLVEAELLYQRGFPPQARYVFKHALIQDAAYQSPLRGTRQHYHRQIAKVLEEQFAETRETQPELLAHHYTEAGLIAQAIPYWQRAGQRATQRSAYAEAITHLTQGLALLKVLPDTPERAQQELMLQGALGVPLQATKGYAAPAVQRAYARARELWQQQGKKDEARQLLAEIYGWFTEGFDTKDLQEAKALLAELS